MTFSRTNILLPHDRSLEAMRKWSIVACDQYTSERSYWQSTADFVGDAPSALHLIVPEVYLNDDDIDKRIGDISQTMKAYLDSGVFDEIKNSYIYVERTLANGAVRRGIVGAVDLEDYDYSPQSQTKIRATEGTVVSRIPPRLAVRMRANIELSHIMMLIDDRDCDIIESNSAHKGEFEKLYDFELMHNSGKIVGYRMSDEAADMLDRRLAQLEDADGFEKKYGIKGKSPLVFAMGDGNHSLATAKAYYEYVKQTIGEDAARISPARYALCELVNLHDESLVFEAIHRVVFGADAAEFVSEFEKEFDISYDDDAKGQSFYLVTADGKRKMTVTNPREVLTVATVQGFIDRYIESHGASVDYIHGEDVVKKLCAEGGNVGIILNAMNKNDLFRSVILDGALPRKTFSMGDACDKRFYVEARVINDGSDVRLASAACIGIIT